MAINVRLSEEESRMADRLRAAGVPISTLVRNALRAEYARRIERPEEGQALEILRRILNELPDPPDLAARNFSIRDRRAVQRHIAERLVRARR